MRRRPECSIIKLAGLAEFLTSGILCARPMQVYTILYGSPYHLKKVKIEVRYDETDPAAPT